MFCDLKVVLRQRKIFFKKFKNVGNQGYFGQGV